MLILLLFNDTVLVTSFTYACSVLGGHSARTRSCGNARDNVRNDAQGEAGNSNEDEAAVMLRLGPFGRKPILFIQVKCNL